VRAFGGSSQGLLDHDSYVVWRWAENGWGIVAGTVAKLVAKTLGVNLTVKAILIKIIGRVGLLISSVMDVIAISGPAYRVTVPSVIQIAYIRQKLAYIAYMHQKNNKEQYDYYKIMGYVVFLILLIGGSVFLFKRRKSKIKSG